MVWDEAGWVRIDGWMRMDGMKTSSPRFILTFTFSLYPKGHFPVVNQET